MSLDDVQSGEEQQRATGRGLACSVCWMVVVVVYIKDGQGRRMWRVTGKKRVGEKMV